MATITLLEAASAGNRAAWDELVDEYAPRVWQATSVLSDFGRAVEAGNVVFLRLADESPDLASGDLEAWLDATTNEVMIEAEAARWRTPVPPFETYEGVPKPLVDAAHGAIEVRAGAMPVLQPVYDSSRGTDSRSGDARGVTVAWRAASDATVLPVPEAVWRGVYEFGDVEIDLTLLAAGERRIVGTARGIGSGTVRLRTGEQAAEIDTQERFRIAPVPEGPVSVEITGPNTSIVTEWRTL